MLDLDRRLLAPLQSRRLRFGLAIGLGALGGGLVVWQARLLAGVLDAVFLGGAGVAETRGALGLLAAVVLARFALAWSSEAVAGGVAARIKEELRGRLLRHLVALGPARRGAERTGELAALAGEGVEALDAWYGQYLPQLAWSALVPLTVLVAVFPFDALTGAVLLVTAPLIPLFMVLVGRLARPRALAQWEALRRLSAHFFDLLQGLATLELLGRSRAQAKSLERAGAAYNDATMASLRVAFLSALTLELVATLSTAIVAVEIGLRLLYGRLEFLDAFWLLVLAPEFYQPLRLLGTRFHAGMAGSAAAARLFQFLETPAPCAAGGGRAMALARAPELRLEGVGLRYPDASEPALRGIDLVLAPGTRTALVGPTGAGKSSLASLLLRFLEPSSGRLTVDGEPLDAFSPDSWRTHLSWVGQDPHLFHDTVEANLRLARPGASHEELVRAARLAHAHDFVEALPQGYRTVVGERGSRLSAGQAQRLALARAFLREAPVLVLDEPTSHLDPESERLVSEATSRLVAGRTTVVVAHRLGTIFAADQIVVLDRGSVAARGTHAELTATCPLYRALVDAWAGEERGSADPEPATAPIAVPAAPPGPPPALDRAPGDPRTLRRLLGLARPFAGGIALSVLLGFGTVAASVGLMSAAAYVVAAAALHPSIAVLQPAIVGVRFFGISRGVLRYLERLVSHRVSLELLARLRVTFLRGLEPLAPAALVRRRRGDLLARAVGDVNALEGFYVRALAPPLVAACVALAAALFLGLFDPRLALALLGFQALGGIALPAALRRLGAAPGRRTVGARARVVNGAVDGVQGLAELVAFGRGADYLREQADHSQSLADAQRRTALLSGLQSAGAALAANLATLAVVVAAIPLVRAGVLEGLSLPVIALATLTSFELVPTLSGAAQHLEADRAAARRLFEILDTPPPIAEPPRPEPLPVSTEVRVKGLRFRYEAPGEPPGPWAIDGFDLELPAGRHVALVGASGCGKSTLTRLLVRFLQPTEGSITLGGVALDRLAQDEVRGRFSALLQDAHLFDTTVRENLRVADPAASEATLLGALALAQATEFVDALPQGLETCVGERGLRLSGGERHRLLLARTLLREAPLLLLDEPTDGLDPVTEAKVMQGLRGHCAGRSLLLVTHRLTGLEWMDEIVVLEQGRIVERGRQTELLGRDGPYQRLWRAQRHAGAPPTGRLACPSERVA